MSNTKSSSFLDQAICFARAKRHRVVLSAENRYCVLVEHADGTDRAFLGAVADELEPGILTVTDQATGETRRIFPAWEWLSVSVDDPQGHPLYGYRNTKVQS